MRDISRVLLVPFFVFAMQPDSAASQQKVSCTTVQASAVLEADAGIIVGYFGNPTTQTCTFYARKSPPTNTLPTAQQKATKIALGLWASPDEKQILSEFVPTLQAALLEPLEGGQFEPQFMKAVADEFQAESKTLAQCAVGSFLKKADFQSYSDVISCGVQGNRYFVVEAKTPSLISGLFLPLEE